MQLNPLFADRSTHDFQQLAAELAENPQLLLSILDAIDDRVHLKDSTGHVFFANASFLETYGLTSEQVDGKQIREFLPEEVIAPAEAADQVVYTYNKATRLETCWTDPATGKPRFSETYKAPLRNADGNVTGIVVTSRDTTSRTLTEQELNRQKTLLESILETVPDAIVVKDLQRRILLANQSFYQRHQLTPTETIGTDPSPKFQPELQKASLESDTHVLESGQPTSGNVSLTDPRGQKQFLEYRKLPLTSEGRITGILTVCRDLTDWKKAEEQSKRTESLLLRAARLTSLGALSAGIAHEVNQPLFSILNYAKAIRNNLQQSDEINLQQISTWIDEIHREAERGGQITRHLAAFAKPTETRRAPSRLDAIILESVQLLSSEARDAGVELKARLDEEVPELVFDRTQIQQALIHLLQIAIEASSRANTSETNTEPNIVVSTHQTDGQAKVSVTGNSAKIPASHEVNLLDPIEESEQEAMGLELAISKAIIEAHAGQLTYSASPTGGATFTFSLPMENMIDNPEES